MSATVALRDELAHVGTAQDCCADAELSALLRFGGSVTLSDAGLGFAFESTSGAVTRRTRELLGTLAARRGLDLGRRVEVHRPGGLQPSARYRLVLSQVAPLLVDLGLLDSAGLPVEGVAVPLTRAACDATAYVRGALMAAGSMSGPGSPAHLEVRAPGPRSAAGLARLVSRCGGHGARAAAHGERWRVVVKSGAEVGAVLARVGAHAVFLRWDSARLTRELRGDANRAANAERANIERAVEASSRQVEAIDAALAAVGWAALPPDVAATALARLANPEASLAEVGALLDPPVGKATVHRRLARLLRLAEVGVERADQTVDAGLPGEHAPVRARCRDR